MSKTTDIKKLASEMVGDGKKPNKFFVTIAYGWYLPMGDSDQDMVQAKNSLDSVTVLFTDKIDAVNFFDNVPINCSVDKVTGETIGQVMIEDRLTGVIGEMYLEQRSATCFRKTYLI